MVKKYFSAALPVVLVCAPASPASADGHSKSPTLLEAVKRLGYSDAQIEELKQGKIVAIDLKRDRGDQLIAAVAAGIEAPLAALAETVKKGINIQRDAGVPAFREISGTNYGFEKVAYETSESPEIKRLLGVKASDTFNLSSKEIASLQETFKGVKAGDAAVAETVSQAYRDILKGRLDACLKDGLDGITHYDHGSNSSSPAEELKAVDERVEPFLSAYFPALKRALLGFPGGQSPDVSSQFYWIKRNVEGRPAVILAHQLVQESDDFVLLTQR